MANIDSLVEVIKTNLAKGVPAEKLVESAKAAGWSDEDIDNAFKQVNQPPAAMDQTSLTQTIQVTTQEQTATVSAQLTQSIRAQNSPQEQVPTNKLDELKQTLLDVTTHPRVMLEREAVNDASIGASLKKLALQGALIGAFMSVGLMYLLIALVLIAPDVLSNFEILAFTDLISGVITLAVLTLALVIGNAIFLPLSELISNVGTLIVSKIAGGKGQYVKQLQLTSYTNYITVATFAPLVVPFIGLLITTMLLIPLALIRLYALIRAVQFTHEFTGKKAAIVILLVPFISFLIGVILPLLSATQ